MKIVANLCFILSIFGSTSPIEASLKKSSMLLRQTKEASATHHSVLKVDASSSTNTNDDHDNEAFSGGNTARVQERVLSANGLYEEFHGISSQQRASLIDQLFQLEQNKPCWKAYRNYFNQEYESSDDGMSMSMNIATGPFGGEWK